jgi:hypothetical protein
MNRVALHACIMLVLVSLVHAQKTSAPQPVNVVNVPSVTVSNSSLPVSGNVQVTNLPLDANGNLKTASANNASGVFEFTHIVFNICDPNPVSGWSTHMDLCPVDANNPTPADTVLGTLSSQGWELISVAAFSWNPCPLCTAQPITPGVLYTFRRPLK